MSVLTVSFIALLAAGIILCREILARWRNLKVFRRGNIPMVPVRNIFKGHLTEIIFRPDNVKLFDKIHQNLGKTFGLFYGPNPSAVTCDPELLYQLFVTEGNRFVDINDFRMPYSAEFANSLGQMRGTEWRIMRKALNPMFTTKQLKSDNVYRDIEDSTDELIAHIEQHLATKGHGTIDILHLSKIYSLGAFCKIGFGRNLEPKVLDKLLETIHSVINEGNNIGVRLSIIFGKQVQEFIASIVKFTPIGGYFKFIGSIMSDSVKLRRKICASELAGNRKMIDTVVEIVRRHKLDENILSANLFFFLMAGFDTTSNAMASLFWLLATHPDKQQLLRESIIRDGENSEYLTWCIKEGLRLYPSVPTGIGRELDQDWHFDGMTFYKGTSIIANFYTLHRQEEFWGQDANEFRPERFGEPMKHQAQFLAFGAGPRNCIGYNFAMIELRHAISHTIAKYQLVTCPSTPKKLDFTSPNLIHLILDNNIPLKLVKV